MAQEPQPEEDIWSLARITPSPSTIRFAEDLLPQRKVGGEAKERKGKKGRRIRFTEEVEEEMEGL